MRDKDIPIIERTIRGQLVKALLDDFGHIVKRAQNLTETMNSIDTETLPSQCHDEIVYAQDAVCRITAKMESFQNYLCVLDTDD